MPGASMNDGPHDASVPRVRAITSQADPRNRYTPAAILWLRIQDGHLMIGDPRAVPGDEASVEDWKGEIAETLTRVLASAAFSGSERSRAFLAYVVTETLAGRGDRLSERTVGRRALDHGAAFDGRTDASVRVRATRVRKALRRLRRGGGRCGPRADRPADGYLHADVLAGITTAPGRSNG